MKNTYNIKNCSPNPRNNTRVDYGTMMEAVQALRDGMTSDEPETGTSTMFKNGNAIAFRDWNKNRVSWL